jgi:hypothetical protein
MEVPEKQCLACGFYSCTCNGQRLPAVPGDYERRAYPQPPTNQVDAIAKAANEMADMIQLIDLDDTEYQDWQVIVGAMGPATYDRRMDDL